jgi:hypothetical protein
MINISISTGYLVTTSQAPDYKPSPGRTKEEMKTISANRFQGVISPRSASKIKGLLSAWDYDNELYNSTLSQSDQKFKKQFTFATLTLPSKQIHSHEEIKRGPFNTFIISILRKSPQAKYFWKAELQKNGNIHFHVLFDCFIHWSIVRSIWNTAIESLSYVSRYRQKCLDNYGNNYAKYLAFNHLSDSYKAKTAFLRGVQSDWSDPNSTDIHSLTKVRSGLRYLAKYVSKQVEKNADGSPKQDSIIPDFGRIYGSSDSLRSIRPTKVRVDSGEMKLILEYLSNKINKTIELDYATIYLIEDSMYKSVRFDLMQNFSTPLPSFDT